jgi:hypothetical protein
MYFVAPLPLSLLADSSGSDIDSYTYDFAIGSQQVILAR